MMRGFDYSKMGIHSKNDTLFIKKKLGCNFSRGQMGTMHIFIISGVLEWDWFGVIGEGILTCSFLSFF